ncbi:MAG: hypothetical protein JWQ98_3589 [Chlorobi bacterium]|nr:hypothetical protein [Chlorobiota bacterium]
MSGNIIGIFIANAERFPEKPAIIDGDRAITYGELLRDVRNAARYLAERGIGKGDPMLIFVPMSIDLYTILLAAFHIGAVGLFVDAWSDRRRLAAACRMLPPRAFVGVPKAHLLRLLSPGIRAIPIKLFAGAGRWRARGKGAIAPPAAVQPDDPALVTMTTGSTGMPKGARRTHRFLVAQHDALVRSLGSSAGDIDMPLLPVFVLSNLALGATTVIPPVDPRNVESFDPSSVVDVIRRAGVTSTSGSPAFYDLLAAYCAGRDIALPSLRTLALGGAPVFPRLASSLVAAFPDVAIMIVYGSTEAEPISTITAGELIRDPAGIARRGLPVGNPTPDIEVMILPIRDEIVAGDRAELDGMRLPAEEIGEICVAGEHVLKEYYGDAAVWRKNKIFVGDEIWHRTGDAGYLDAGGRLYLAGRVRQSFIHGGERIFVFPIEERLLEMEGIAAGTIMKIGERLVVAVEPLPGAARTVAEIETMIAEAGIPCDAVMAVSAIPRDPRHRSKIDYDRLRDLLEKR